MSPPGGAGGGPGANGPATELLARAFNAAPNGFVLVDRDGRIVAANDELQKMFGHAQDALVGQPLEMLLPAALRHAHGPLREAYFANPVPRTMGAGRVLYARRADGHEFPVEIGLNPVAAPDGAPLVLASVVDISERLALEWAFRGLFDAAPFGMLIVDDEGRIAMANRVLCDALGYSAAELAGQPLDRLLPERYRARHGGLMAGYRGTGEARVMGQGRDLTALHADGTELPVEIGLRRVRWQRQAMTLAAVTDISLRKRLERELRQANANLEEFTYVASHDLRSPLRGIADLVEWIEADLGEPPPAVRHNLERISQRIVRMERLMDDLLSYARAGRAATELSTIDLAALLRGVLEIQPPPPGIEVTLALDAEPFQGTRTPLETVLRNLLSNAVKHHDRASGRLRVEARQDDVNCTISVIDDGPGVPEAAHERVFKLFQTAAASQRSGSGIGLALTKRLVEVHGGRIELQSPVADGRGACFRVHWPRFPRRTTETTEE